MIPVVLLLLMTFQQRSGVTGNSLLKVATQLKRVPEDAVMWPGHWVTDHSAIEFGSESPMLTLHDYARHAVTQLPGLSKLFEQTDGEGHYNAHISPDGKWLMWLGSITNRPGKQPIFISGTFAARLDGTGFMKRPVDNEPIGQWMSDSRHWIRFEQEPPKRRGKTVSMPINPANISVYVCDFNSRNRPVRWLIPRDSRLSGNGAEVGVNALIAPDGILISDWQTMGVPPMSILDNGRGRLEIYRYRLSKPARPIWKRTIRFPSTDVIYDVAFATSGERLAWITVGDYSPRGWRVALWMANLPNGEPTCLGTLNAETGNYGPNMHQLRWMPGDKRIGFVLQKRFFTVAAKVTAPVPHR